MGLGSYRKKMINPEYSGKIEEFTTEYTDKHRLFLFFICVYLCILWLILQSSIVNH